jgi:tetratricopeptide (TPR) repeat protein
VVGNSSMADDPAAHRAGQRAIFLSYASEDTAAARRLCEALRAGGIEVWFDQSELRGGDAWDAAIRRQIKSCSLFVPIISKSSHSRAEGYFRLEWKLAIDRSHLIAPHLPFLLPIVIDDTAEIDERIPERFRDVQWIRAPQGEPPAGFAQHVEALLARAPGAEPGGAAPPPSSRSLHPTATTPPTAPAPAPRRRWTLAWLAGAVVVAALIGVGAMRYLWHPAAVAAYSVADRRMTFAVLPFHAPADDEIAARVAKATADVVIDNLESASIWCQMAPRARVDAAVAKYTGARELADALDVHFLIRGTLQPAREGYTLNLALINGATEQTLFTSTLSVPQDKLKPVFDDDVDTAVYHLVLAGMHEEVQRADGRPADALDVRDLSFRAFDYWRHHRGKEAKAGYFSASDLLNRALKLAPDDPLATYLTADINLCDCVMGWSTRPDEQRAIGTAALEKYLRGHPTDPEMLLDKAGIMQLRGRYDEALVVTNAVLQRHPDHSVALGIQVTTLVHLDRAREAIPLADELASRFPDKWEDLTWLAADAHYAVGDYVAASTLAANAAARADETDLKSPIFGAVRLTLAAAEARIGHADRARHALEDFYAAAPSVHSITALRKWIYPTDPLANFEPFYTGLKLAGMPD